MVKAQNGEVCNVIAHLLINLTHLVTPKQLKNWNSNAYTSQRSAKLEKSWNISVKAGIP